MKLINLYPKWYQNMPLTGYSQTIINMSSVSHIPASPLIIPHESPSLTGADSFCKGTWRCCCFSARNMICIKQGDGGYATTKAKKPEILLVLKWSLPFVNGYIHFRCICPCLCDYFLSGGYDPSNSNYALTPSSWVGHPLQWKTDV